MSVHNSLVLKNGNHWRVVCWIQKPFQQVTRLKIKHTLTALIGMFIIFGF